MLIIMIKLNDDDGSGFRKSFSLNPILGETYQRHNNWNADLIARQGIS